MNRVLIIKISIEKNGNVLVIDAVTFELEYFFLETQIFELNTMYEAKFFLPYFN